MDFKTILIFLPSILLLGVLIIIVQFIFLGAEEALGKFDNYISKLFGKKTSEELPYKRKKYLITEAEKNFYLVLREIFSDKYQIFVQIRLSDLVYVPRGSNDRFHSRSLIKQKYMDFVICDSTNLSPLLVIELDDNSHNGVKRIKRDDFVNRALETAGLPFLRVKCSYDYDKVSLKDSIRELLVD